MTLWLLTRHYDRTRDLEFVRSVYERLVVQPAEFMASYRDPSTGLPLTSFDVWEERQGVFTFTCAAVFAAMKSAAGLANLFNEPERRMRYEQVAAEIRDGMIRHLWLDAEQRFARGLVLRDDSLELDRTVDASTFATFYLGVFAADSTMVERSMNAVREKLWVGTEAGGLARYEDDTYQRQPGHEDVKVPGNPWVICTLWLAEYAVARATSIDELNSALDLVRWARAKARPSLVLPEQIDPFTGAPLGVAPFTWSHAQVVSVVRGYLESMRRFRRASSEGNGRFQGVDKPEIVP